MAKFIPLAVKDNAEAQLNASISASSVSTPLQAGQGSVFPETKNGQCDSAGDNNTLNSTGVGALGAVVGDAVYNITKGASARITVITTNQITTTDLPSGVSWDDTDEFVISNGQDYGPFVLTLTKRSGGVSTGTVTQMEKVLITERTGDTLKCQLADRGFGGTTPAAFDADDFASLFWTQHNSKEMFDEISRIELEKPDTEDVVLKAIGTTSGDVMYFNGADWLRVGIGLDNEVLTVIGGIPSWVAPAVASGKYGDGSDGVLTISSGTTTIAPNIAKQYESISITGGELNLSGKGVIIIKCKGDCVINGGSINVEGQNGGGGVGAVAARSTTGQTATDAIDVSAYSDVFSTQVVGASGGNADFDTGGWTAVAASGGAGGGSGLTVGGNSTTASSTDSSSNVATALGATGAGLLSYLLDQFALPETILGSDGAGGGAVVHAGGSGTITANGGQGGTGGGGVILLVGGNLTISGTAIKAGGGNGLNASGSQTTSNYARSSGGGGAGGGGSVFVLCAGSITGSDSSIDTGGGTGGAGADASSSGSYGTDSTSGGVGANGKKILMTDYIA